MPETKARLLIVDDEPSIRLSLSCVLAEIGYRVRTAEDGFSALTEIRKEVPEIILSDLNMPGMSGFELLSVVRRRFPAIQTIAMSGAFCGDEMPSGVAADAFYQKSSSVGSLLRMMENLPWHERVSFQHGTALVLLWTKRDDNAREANVTIFCPECLRTFSLALNETVTQMRETVCVHCHSLIQTAIALPADEESLLSFQQSQAFPSPALSGMQTLNY